MSRANELLSAALLRPVNLLAPGAGLLSSLTWAPWWVFPASIVPYAAMVLLTLRDPGFVRKVTTASADESAGDALDWASLQKELGRGEWAGPLARIAAAERNLTGELARAPDAARGVLSSTLGQVRTACGYGMQLARRLKSLDQALVGYGMNADLSRSEAAEKRARSATVRDPAAQKALGDAATALEEAAKTADSLRTLRERTSAQLESLSAMLESVAVRAVRLRVQSDPGAGDIAEALGAEMDAVRETLGVLESMDEPGGAESRGVGE
jgi:hypothetical protein